MVNLHPFKVRSIFVTFLVFNEVGTSVLRLAPRGISLG